MDLNLNLNLKELLHCTSGKVWLFRCQKESESPHSEWSFLLNGRSIEIAISQAVRPLQSESDEALGTVTVIGNERFLILTNDCFSTENYCSPAILLILGNWRS
jgi:hypothetical protein